MYTSQSVMRRLYAFLTLSILVTSSLFVGFLSNPEQVDAATITAASCSNANIQTAVNSAAAGDTVFIPAGDCTLTGAVTISKAIILKGAGVGQTILRKTSNIKMFHINTPASGTFFMSDLTIQAGGFDTSEGTIQVHGTANNLNAFRFHHFELLNAGGRGFGVYLEGYDIGGLIDHGNISFKGSGAKWYSMEGTGPEEHQPFTFPFALGSNRAVFIEDNYIDNLGPQVDGWQDAYSGSNYVWRYNTHVGCPTESGHHGADSGNQRGTRSFEYYNNTYTQTRTNCSDVRITHPRSGTGVMFNNTWTGSQYNNYGDNEYGMELVNYRSNESMAPWGKCDGSSAWDENRPGEGGYACLDQIGHVFTASKGGVNQLVPLYEWNNKINGQDADFYAETANHNSSKHIKENRDFYNDTVKPGYTPYTYPHPLQSQGGGGTPPPTNPPPTVSITATPASITSGQSSNLSWSSTNATSCTASNGWTGSKAMSGTQAVAPTVNTTYTLTCTGAGGSAAASASVTVTTSTTPPSTKFSAGQQIQVNTGDGSNLNVRSSANGSIVGQQPDGTLGSIVGGGTFAGSFYWWNVNFASGVDGWAAEDFLIASNTTPPPPPPPSGTTYYVGKTGCSNSTTAGTITQPWCTIAYATGRIASGNTLYVRAGTYSEQFEISGPAGTPSAWTTIAAYPGETVILQGSGNSGREKIINTSYLKFEGFKITNFQSGLFVENSHDILLSNLEVYSTGQEGVHIKVNSYNVTLQNSSVHDTGTGGQYGEGIYVGTSGSTQEDEGANDNTNNILIKNNTVNGTNDECIEIKEGTYSVTIEGNTLSNCLKDSSITDTNWGSIELMEREGHYGGSPMHVVKNNVINTTKTAMGVHTSASIFNNVIYGQTGSFRGISIDNPDGDSFTRGVYHNTIDLPSSRAVAGSGDVRNNIGPSATGNMAASVALFVNSAARDYHLAASSAAINAGGALPSVSGIGLDKDGMTRPQGSAPDVGAYESGGTAPPPPPPGTPIVTITASPSSITSGQSSTLMWSSTNATSCTASGGWSGSKATSGTETVSPTTNSTYTLSCTGAGGTASGTASGSATVAVSATTPPPPTSTKFMMGDKIVTTQSVAVRATPGGTKLGSQGTNSLGIVTGGPTPSGTNTWWQIDYGSGVDGWSAEAYLAKYTPPFAIGGRVQTTDSGIGVRNAPAGTRLGTQALNAAGTVLGGPSSANGNVWWQIDYDVAPDGWTAEKFLTTSTTPPPTTQPPPPPPPADDTPPTTPTPTVTVSANPTSITTGQSSMISWSSANASSCTASGGWSGNKATSGTQSVSPTANTTYTLTCTGSGGTASDSVSITITAVTTPPPAPTVSLSASPISITSGQSSTLTWSADNATSCTATGGWSGNKATSGTQSVSPTSNATYALSCMGSGGSASQSTSVSVTTVTTPPPSGATVTMGETAALSGTDGQNDDTLQAQKASLAEAGTLTSLSFYVKTAAGQLRLAVYDATGTGGGPGTLKAQTDAFTATTGWNTANVTSPVALSAGTYWLAFMPSNSNLTYAVDWDTGEAKGASFDFGALPATFPAVNSSGDNHWSMYATLYTGEGPKAAAPAAQLASSGAVDGVLEALKQVLLGILGQLQSLMQ